MSLARARRRWLRWDRYLNRMIKLSPAAVGTPGAWKAYNQRARWHNAKLERRARRDAAVVIGAVLDAVDAAELAGDLL